MMIHQAWSGGDIDRGRADDSALIYRLEGELRGTIKPTVSAESICFVHDLEAEIVSGLLSGHHLTGLNQLTLRADGVGLIAGLGTIECDAEPISLDIRGCVVLPPHLSWPRSEVAAAPGFEFADHDYRVAASALVRTIHPVYAHLDGTAASVEGWINFESGEVEVEARTM
jgi:hypothetical protein